MINMAIRDVLATPSQDVIENNRAFHKLLASGVPVQVNENGETRTVGLRLLDRDAPKTNRLLVANQVIIQGDDGTVRADVVVFVNGLPLALLELKSPVNTAARWSAPTRSSVIIERVCRNCFARTRCW